MKRARAVPDFAAWRDEARALLAADVPPDQVAWVADGETGLLFEERFEKPPAAPAGEVARVPKRFVRLAADVVLHREPGAHALCYRVLWRLSRGEHGLLDDAADPDVRQMAVRARAIAQDLHKMHAFVRFREVEGAYVAWYQPNHHILARAAPFFVERFHGMRWAILTPDASIEWDGDALAWGPGVPRTQAPAEDEVEDLWRTYYASIFNPARANPKVMRSHMPSRFWPQLPETALIPDLLAKAGGRTAAMVDAASQLGGARSIDELREAARSCSACDLCGPATQTVFGEGPIDAPLVLVGEQPGDEEDRTGHPFVGPAGHVLDDALREVGIDRARTYVTNAVKHFRFIPTGKKRLHQRPTVAQVRACKPWVGAELQAIQPRVVVCLGSTAAQSLVNSRFKISEQRGQLVQTNLAPYLLATHHPAAILRVDPDKRPRYEAELRADLAIARDLLRA